jgi:hypothetical protein
MKEMYTKPEAEVKEFTTYDVVTTSGDDPIELPEF